MPHSTEPHPPLVHMNNNKEAPMNTHDENGNSQDSQDKVHAGQGYRGENTSGKKPGVKDAERLPNGSGTDTHGTDSEHGQENEGQSYDAG